MPEMADSHAYKVCNIPGELGLAVVFGISRQWANCVSFKCVYFELHPGAMYHD